MEVRHDFGVPVIVVTFHVGSELELVSFYICPENLKPLTFQYILDIALSKKKRLKREGKL